VRWAARFALLSGPLTVLGFFLPWFEGHGLLSGESYSGYELLQLGAWLQDAGLGTATNVGLLVARVVAVGLVIAGLWLTLLAPRGRGHILYVVAGWYVVGAAAVLMVATFAWNGHPVPSVGVAAVTAAAGVWIWEWSGRRAHSTGVNGAWWKRPATAGEP
jgi:hypothetical protein